VNFLSEPGGKIGAIEPDAGQLDPVGLDFDGRTGKLDVRAISRGRGLSAAIP
jgi:hypothetical protein